MSSDECTTDIGVSGSSYNVCVCMYINLYDNFELCRNKAHLFIMNISQHLLDKKKKISFDCYYNCYMPFADNTLIFVSCKGQVKAYARIFTSFFLSI